MKSPILLYLAILLSLLCAGSVSHDLNINGSAATRCLHEQSSLLLQLKREFSFHEKPSGDIQGYPKMKTWNARKDCCEWDGVTCDPATGRVSGLDLSNSWLRGPLRFNSSVFHLRHLQRLNLAYNAYLSSEIPSTIAQLSRLTHLNLSDCNFGGDVPMEISRLTSLVSLDLSHNYGAPAGLYLRMTTLLRNMTKLVVLHLDTVDLSSIQVEKMLANVSNSLTSISLSYCNLNRVFPQYIFQLPKIDTIDLSGNEYLTIFLPEFPSDSNLKSLDLSVTRSSGTLPDSLGNLKSLSTLVLSDCRFSGELPVTLGNLSQLTTLVLSQNSFSGQLPPSLGNLSRLASLFLSCNNFSGQLPPELGNLSRLVALDVSRNNFSGQLPPKLGNLSRAVSLDLSWNNFTGQLPTMIGNRYRLRALRLSANHFVGQIPSTLGNLSRLHHLDLSNNSFNGQLPYALGNLQKLKLLNLSCCSFSGELPSSLGNFTQLVRLDLSWNTFSGRVASSIGNLKSLHKLDLSHNNFDEKLPVEMSNLTQLTRLDLSYNAITSHLPPLSSKRPIENLDLSHNSFNGVIPSSLFSLSIDSLDLSHNQFTGLDNVNNISASNILLLDLHSNRLQGSFVAPSLSIGYLSISENNLSGNLHRSFCDLTDLVFLDASDNNLSGTVPRCLAGLSLEVLDLRQNNFHGNIPDMCLEGSDLIDLELSHNKLTGMVPRSLINCTGLKVLNLGYNQLTHEFPFWLESLPELKVLVLRSNKFHGPLLHREKLPGFLTLIILDLSFNSFTGTLPPELFKNWDAMSEIPDPDMSEPEYVFGGGSRYYHVSVTVANKGSEMLLVKILTTFTSIDLSNNNFHGEIPRTIGDLRSLIVLNLSRNSFRGPIPSSLGNLTQLESLDLSGNKLSGRIPPELTSLTFLQYINVSDNRLAGPIPHGTQFETFGNSSFEGNLDLCGAPLSKRCEGVPVPDERPNPEKLDHSQAQESDLDGGFGWKPVLIGYVSGFLVAVIGGHFIFSKNPNWIVKIYGRRM